MEQWHPFAVFLNDLLRGVERSRGGEIPFSPRDEGFPVEISATTIWDLLTPYQARQIH